jgi:hypothetical protein
VAVNIKSPDAGTTVSGDPLHVVIHYNSQERMLLKSKVMKVHKVQQSKKFQQAQQAQQAQKATSASFWRLTCSVEGVEGTTGHWQQSAVVSATGDPGADRPFEFFDEDGPIPDGTYEISGSLCFVMQFGGGLAVEILFGTDTHNPVEVA